MAADRDRARALARHITEIGVLHEEALGKGRLRPVLDRAQSVYDGDPRAAVVAIATVSATRHRRLADLLGLERHELLELTRERLERAPGGDGSKVAPACVALIRAVFDDGVEEQMVTAALAEGIVGFLALLAMSRTMAELVVSHEPALASVADLLAREGLIAEREWLTGQ